MISRISSRKARTSSAPPTGPPAVSRSVPSSTAVGNECRPRACEAAPAGSASTSDASTAPLWIAPSAPGACWGMRTRSRTGPSASLNSSSRSITRAQEPHPVDRRRATTAPSATSRCRPVYSPSATTTASGNGWRSGSAPSAGSTAASASGVAGAASGAAGTDSRPARNAAVASSTDTSRAHAHAPAPKAVSGCQARPAPCTASETIPSARARTARARKTTLRTTVVREIGAAEASPKQPHETPSSWARTTSARKAAKRATATRPTTGRSRVKGCRRAAASSSSSQGNARARAGAANGRGTLSRVNVACTSSPERSFAVPLRSMMRATAQSADMADTPSRGFTRGRAAGPGAVHGTRVAEASI